MFVATDLHGHTRFSDGRTTPEEYVEFRGTIGMKAISIADHDLLAGVRRGSVIAARRGMMFIPALEVTSFLHFQQSNAEQFHVLAYYPADVLEGYKLEGTMLYQRGIIVQKKWQTFVLEWFDKLSVEGKEKLEPEGELQKLHFSEFPALQSMILRIVARHKELFTQFRDNHVRFWEEDKELFGWTPEEAIEAIRGDGAVDIIAHPTRYRDKERTDKVIDFASGLEVYTSRHKPEVAEHFRQLAESRRKYWTSSSDDHQNAKYAKPPCGTPVRTLERILRKTMPVSWLIADGTKTPVAV